MEISIQTGDVVDVLGFEKGYAAIKEAGFTAIDWSLDHAWKKKDLYDGTYRGKCIMERPLEEVIAYYEEERKIIQKNDIKISQAHAPYLRSACQSPELVEYAIEVYKRNIEYCDYAECGNLVIHGLALTAIDKVHTSQQMEEINWHLYEALIPTLLKYNVTVCLENLIEEVGGKIVEGDCSDPHQAVARLDALNEKAGREVFGLCLDTGHMNLLGRDFRNYIPIVGNRIKALHIHDNDGIKDLHMAPMTGTIDWNIVCQELHRIEYDGDLSFETFAQTNKAMDVDMELLFPWLQLISKTGQVFQRKIQEGTKK